MTFEAPNKSAASNPAIAFRFQVGDRWRGVGEPDRCPLNALLDGRGFPAPPKVMRAGRAQSRSEGQFLPRDGHFGSLRPAKEPGQVDHAGLDRLTLSAGHT
jgi:hypothetical protein